MKNHRNRIAGIIAFACFLLSGCVPISAQSELDGKPVNETITATMTPFQPSKTSISLYISPGLPEEWISSFDSIHDLEIVGDEAQADLAFLPIQIKNDSFSLYSAKMIFAVAVPFLTVDDDISMEEIETLWSGNTGTETYQTLYVSKRTCLILSDFLGEFSDHVKQVDEDSLVSNVEQTDGSIAILPFDEITPRLKILKINGMSPLDKPFSESDYPLTLVYQLVNRREKSDIPSSIIDSVINSVPMTNRDESKMTVIVMSGTTAMARCTAAKILIKGTDYPIEMVKDWFLKADIRHVSNEVSVSDECPRINTCNTTLRLCAHPESIEVMEKLGVNVVELTGNHVNDYGTESFIKTIEIYKEKGWYTFGGGLNPEDARKPAIIENNGNKIAFIGCNPVGYTSAWAKEGYPGAAKCDSDYLHSQIKELKEQGYVVITTYQHNEIYEYMYSDPYRKDFQEAIEAGADIVQGSQAHFPMGFELIGNKLIHYGLGNFLFDQMDIPVVGTRREFIDRHIIYDGKYINTELLTALLTDWSRPVPMTQSDRSQFLQDLFEASKKRLP